MTASPLENTAPRFGDTLLEGMQERVGMPYHPPTLQFVRSERHTQRFVPVNPLARSILAAFRHAEVTAGQVVELEGCGFAVEFRS